MLRQLLFTLATAGFSSAHFILHWPPTAGFDDELEGTSPCGAATVTLNSSNPQVEVDRFAIMIQSSHPTGEWAFRGTTDTEPPYSFTDISPIVNTTGIGDFCLDYISAPGDWAGKPGIIQVVDNSLDGVLYQCAPVNFVSGANSTLGSACTNATGFTATWTNLESFNESTSSSSGTATTSTAPGATSASGSAASSMSSAGAPMVTGIGSLVGALGIFVAVLPL